MPPDAASRSVLRDVSPRGDGAEDVEVRREGVHEAAAGDGRERREHGPHDARAGIVGGVVGGVALRRVVALVIVVRVVLGAVLDGLPSRALAVGAGRSIARTATTSSSASEGNRGGAIRSQSTSSAPAPKSAATAARITRSSGPRHGL